MTNPQEPGQADQQLSRRVVVRGALAFGLLGATGISVGGCGDDSTSAAGSAPAPAGPTPTPIRPGARTTQPTSKSDVYQRGPEPRPTRSAAPVEQSAPAAAPEATPAPTPAAGGEPAAGSRSGDNLATARQRDTTGSGRPTATPAPLPPGAFARTSDIPVGGGKTFKEQKIVVTQPTAGQYKGFSATCTHTGCLVDKVESRQIVCPCHGSRFSIDDGTVEKGPALLALPAEKIVVSSDGAISKG